MNVSMNSMIKPLRICRCMTRQVNLIDMNNSECKIPLPRCRRLASVHTKKLYTTQLNFFQIQYNMIWMQGYENYMILVDINMIRECTVCP